MKDTVAVIGSLESGRTYDPPLRNCGLGLQACRELGGHLAEAGFGLTVYSSNPRFVEAAVVAGYAASPAAKPRAIRVLSPISSSHKQFTEMGDRAELFEVINDPGADWEVSFYRSLASVSGVLL